MRHIHGPYDRVSVIVGVILVGIVLRTSLISVGLIRNQTPLDAGLAAGPECDERSPIDHLV